MINHEIIESWIDSSVSFSFARASGPGGQNVNKVNSKVIASLAITDSAPISEDQRARLMQTLKNRINSEGVLMVQAQRGRTQMDNRRRAVKRMKHLIFASVVPPKPRRPTKPTRRANEQRLQQKRVRGEKKVRRSWKRTSHLDE